jgi:hypothetical protein
LTVSSLPHFRPRLVEVLIVGEVIVEIRPHQLTWIQERSLEFARSFLDVP